MNPQLQSLKQSIAKRLSNAGTRIGSLFSIPKAHAAYNWGTESGDSGVGDFYSTHAHPLEISSPDPYPELSATESFWKRSPYFSKNEVVGTDPYPNLSATESFWKKNTKMDKTTSIPDPFPNLSAVDSFWKRNAVNDKTTTVSDPYPQMSAISSFYTRHPEKKMFTRSFITPSESKLPPYKRYFND